jgi:molybdopterin-binding protein
MTGVPGASAGRTTLANNTKRRRRTNMQLSARNQLAGTVQDVKSGAVMAEITVNIDASTVTAAITDASRERLNLKAGDQVTVVIKSTEVMIAKD